MMARARGERSGEDSRDTTASGADTFLTSAQSQSLSSQNWNVDRYHGLQKPTLESET